MRRTTGPACTAPLTGRHRSDETKARCPACGASATTTRSGSSSAQPSTRSEALGLSRSTNATHEQLVMLAHHGFWGVRSNVAANRRTPPMTLRHLAKDRDSEVRTNVAANPSTPPDALHSLADDHDRDVRMWVAANAASRERTLDRLARDKFPDVREKAALNARASASMLVALASDPEDFVRVAAARNPTTPIGVIAELSEDSAGDVSIVAAGALSGRMRSRFSIAEGNTEAADRVWELERWWERAPGDPEVALIMAMHPNP